MLKRLLRPLITLCAAIGVMFHAGAQHHADIDISLIGGSGSGDFAPYYIAANNNGRISQKNNLLIDASVSGKQSVNRYFSYSWGVEAIGGYSSSVDYQRYDADTETWYTNPQHPPRGWIQQLYGRIDYRSLFLWAGARNAGSALLNDALSSGDLIESANARAIPQVRAGFNNFQPVPFTNGWLEIQGEISYGKMTDNGWLKSHANLYNDHVCLGSYYTYKRCYFRSKSTKPLHLTLGMQVASFFGGNTTTYNKGKVISYTKHHAGIKEFLKMIIPTGGDEDYYYGSILGSWDIMLTYRLPHGGTLKGYMQKPWETGSGIGFLNGFDGLWGLEYQSDKRGWLNGAVVEYLDFTNQSGPIHFDPTDIPNCKIPYHTDGADDYYNNYTYNAYANYGMSLGTPFLKSPLYNTDGYMAYVDNAVRGFHIGVTGNITNSVSYRLLGGYRKGWGTRRIARAEAVDDTSMMVEAIYKPHIVNTPLTVTARIALDRGKMYGNTIGAMLTINYHTSLNIGRK